MAEDETMDDGEFVTAAVSPASTSNGGGDVEERRKLLAECYSSPSVIRFKLSSAATEVSSSEYDTAPVHKK